MKNRKKEGEDEVKTTTTRTTAEHDGLNIQLALVDLAK